MGKIIVRAIHKAAAWFEGAQQRAQRRKSPWNVILLPLGLAAAGATWYGIFRLVWAFHIQWYPHHELHDFWGSGIGFRSFVPSFLMVFALTPGALCVGMAAANCLAWLVRPARRTFAEEAVGHPGTGFRESTVALFRLAAWVLALGFTVALLGACFLKSLT